MAAGVDRDLLDEAPEERARYVGIGGTVLSTAGVAAGAMALLVSTVLGASGWAIVLPSLLWGLLIFNLDRWLIASTHGVSRRWMLIPRIILAVLLGIVVAEPLVLWTFRSAIEQEIVTQRTEDLDALETDLRFCNPVDATQRGDRQTLDRCDELVLNVAAPPGTAVAELRAQLKTATDDRDVLRLQQVQLADRLQRERAGEGGGGTTTQRGDGPVAQALAADLEDVQRRLDTANVLVQQREEALTAETNESSESVGALAEELKEEIDTRLEEERATFSDPPGLLERIEGLGSLTNDNRHLFFVRWFLTLFIVALDCMPVLAKAMSGKTAYDRMLDARLSARERAGRASLTAEGDAWAAEIALRTFDQEQRRTVARRRIEVDRDKHLLLLDTEHRDDQARHGGSPAQISDVLLDEGSFGPTIEFTWEQSAEERGRSRSPWRWRRGEAPMPRAEDHRPRLPRWPALGGDAKGSRSSGDPIDPGTGDLDASEPQKGWPAEEWWGDDDGSDGLDHVWHEHDDHGQLPEQREGVTGSGDDSAYDDSFRRSKVPPHGGSSAVSGGSWFEDVTRLDADGYRPDSEGGDRGAR
jgi:hypothetical protein